MPPERAAATAPPDVEVDEAAMVAVARHEGPADARAAGCGPARARRRPGKRIFDLLVAAVCLVLLVPVMAIIAGLVLLDTGRPVLFRQERVGRGGRPFRILKFRTMYVGAQRAQNVSPAGDPRVTRVGRVLRSTYLDELPQLVNIVAGDMSLVGPRPETPEFVAMLDGDELDVLTVRPGLVGPSTLQFMDEATLLARAEDPADYYRTTLVHERARADLTYLERQGFRYDLGVLLRQALAIVRQR